MRSACRGCGRMRDMHTSKDETVWLAISPHPLDAGEAVAFVSDARAGGINVFLGTTRQEEKRELLALEYEAYSEMALSQMRALAVEARRKWPVVKLALL